MDINISIYSNVFQKDTALLFLALNDPRTCSDLLFTLEISPKNPLKLRPTQDIKVVCIIFQHTLRVGTYTVEICSVKLPSLALNHTWVLDA